MILEGKIKEVINATQVRVECISDDNKEYTCNIPIDKFNNYGENTFSIEDICDGLNVLFVVPERGNVERRGYVINFYNDTKDYIVNNEMKEKPIKSIMFKDIAFKILRDGSFSFYSIGKMFGIFFNAFYKKLSISVRSLDIGTSSLRIKSDDENGNQIVISGKAYNLSFGNSGDEFTLKDNIGNYIKINKTSVDISMKNKKDISVNGLSVKKDKTVYSRFSGKIEMNKNSLKVTHGSSKIYAGKSGVEMSSSGSGFFVDKAGNLTIQSDKDIRIISNSLKVKTNSTQMKSTSKTQIEATKMSLNDGSGKISPTIIRKIIKSISTTISTLKPISPTGPCTPDPVSIGKMATIDANFVKEPVVVNILKEKTKE